MNIKKGKFLETILAEKRLEIAKMPEEQVGKVRQTYNFYDYLKEHSDQLQVIAEVKKASQIYSKFLDFHTERTFGQEMLKI